MSPLSLPIGLSALQRHSQILNLKYTQEIHVLQDLHWMIQIQVLLWNP